jgi:hypothetical protein
MVLFTHLILAVGHTVYILSTRRSSGCWDTFSELVALAQQSQPAESELRNTCAGIHKLETFQHKVRIIRSDEDQEHLELAFGEEQDEAEKAGVVEFGMRYGG